MSEGFESDASVWMARMLNPAATPAERAAFEAWMREDPRHRIAYDNVRAAYDDAASVKHQLRAELARRRQTRRTVIMGLSAGALAAGAGVFSYARYGRGERIATTQGEQRDVQLSDGTRVWLNTDTVLRAHMGATIRRVELLRGEAFFAVALDRARPFVVQAAIGAIEAASGAFNVRRLDGRLLVMVAEGVVTARTSDPTGQAMAVRAGQGLDMEANQQRLQSINVDELERRLAWRDGVLAFDSASLDEIARELSRYTGVRFVFEDAGAAQRRLSVVMSVDGLDEFVRSIERDHPDLTVSRSAGEVRIAARSGEAP